MTHGGHDDESPTNLPSAEPTLAPGRAQRLRLVPTLTIQWHPSVDRVGHAASFAELTPNEPVRLTRNEPSFLDPAGRHPGRGLDDHSLSSSSAAFTLTRTAPGAYQLLRGPARPRVTLNGHLFEGTKSLTDDDLDFGQVIVAGDVTLLLHRCSHPRPPEAPDELGLVGVSDVTRGLRRSVRELAAFDRPVFIRGESGAGKTFLARALHHSGPRAKGPLVEVNMAKLGRDLVDSNLFGHEKGAFTGADQRRAGYFLAANGGTLFLDEIGHAPLDVQRALLKAVEDGEILPLGATRPIKVDVRIIAGTNANLVEKMRDGTFAEELFNRLSADEIIVPPLRDRREDVGLLLLAKLRRVLEKLGQLHRLATPTRSEDRPWLGASAVGEIVRQAAEFRGNIRRLENIANWLVTASDDRANVDGALTKLRKSIEDDKSVAAGRSTPEPNRSPVTEPAARPLKVTAEELRRLFEENGRNVDRVAKKLGRSRSTIYRLVQSDPSIPKTADVDDAAILAAWDEAGGDVDRAAALVKLARRHFQQRLAKARRSAS
jgi:two-component system nitrogen regulation response regulator GlnG